MTGAKAMKLCRQVWYTRLRDTLRGKLDAYLDWRSLVTAADLPFEIADTIRETVRRTWLWRSEKVEITRELIAHFQDGLSTGRTSQQLLHTFGDAKVAARLMRRAKKRARPMAWHTWRWTVRIVAGLAISYCSMAVYYLFGRPSIKVDYLAVVNQRAAAVPESERAWPLYREALTELGGRPAPRGPDFDASDFALALSARPADADWPKVVQFLTQRADSIEKLRQAAVKPALGLPSWASQQSYPPEDRVFFLGESFEQAKAVRREYTSVEDYLLLGVLLPHVRPMCEAFQLLAVDCRRAVLEADAYAALADVRAMLGIARHLQETEFLILGLVAEKSLGLAYEAIRDAISENSHLWSDDELRDLAHEIARTDVDWQRIVSGERAWFYDIVQRIYTDDGEGNGRITREGLELIYYHFGYHFGRIHSVSGWSSAVAAAALPAANFIIAPREQTTALYERYMSAFSRQLKSSAAEWNDTELDVTYLRSSPLLGARYVLLKFLLPETSGVLQTAELNRGSRDGILIGIALELYHREHGRWPARLDELSPRWLPTVPEDRFTGLPLKYRVIDDQPLVYSVGVDKDDDNGKPVDFAAKPSQVFGVADHIGRPDENSNNDGDWALWTTRRLQDDATETDRVETIVGSDDN
jgi:hypothetical protein